MTKHVVELIDAVSFPVECLTKPILGIEAINGEGVRRDQGTAERCLGSRLFSFEHFT